MNAVHPTPSASDGREIDQSRYIKGSDSGDQMIECSQCGFLVNLKTRSTGDSLGAIPSGSATSKSSTFTPPGPGVSQTDTYADPVDTNSGCPLCNTMNPTAAGRGKTGFERVNRSVENL